jgi:hypothetical protein
MCSHVCCLQHVCPSLPANLFAANLAQECKAFLPFKAGSTASTAQICQAAGAFFTTPVVDAASAREHLWWPQIRQRYGKTMIGWQCMPPKRATFLNPFRATLEQKFCLVDQRCHAMLCTFGQHMWWRGYSDITIEALLTIFMHLLLPG